MFQIAMMQRIKIINKIKHVKHHVLENMQCHLIILIYVVINVHSILKLILNIVQNHVLQQIIINILKHKNNKELNV